MALYLIKDLDDDYHSRVGVWQITESEEELRALSSVPSDEMEEISYIKSESLRKQKLAVRCLLDAGAALDITDALIEGLNAAYVKEKGKTE